MASKVEFKDLPHELQEKYLEKHIHKVIRSNHRLLIVHLRSYQKDYWRKQGSIWIKQELEEKT